jgi:sugar diacid utilization regulator
MRLVAGKSGLNRTIRWIYFADCVQCLSDNFDVNSLIYGGELVIVTDKKLTEDENRIINMIRSMNEKNVAGFVINEGQISAQIRNLCNELELPLYELSVSLHLIDVSQIICKALVQEEINVNSLERLFSTILYAKKFSTEEIIGQAKRLGVDLERKQRIVVFETDSSISKKVEQDTVPDSDDDITVFIRREFGFHGLHNLMALRQGNIAVAMVPVSEQFGEDRLVSVLDNVIRRYELHCHKPVRVGIGNCYEYLEDMKESYKEAESALRIASIISSRQKINFYGKMGLYTVISQIPNGKFLDGYVESRIGPLLEADRLQNGSLCDTLKSFLDHGGNANAAAEALYIHRNTMRYRLDKIRKILNSDLGDLSVCLELKLAFAIQRYRRNMK